jgi:hypothetical protein
MCSIVCSPVDVEVLRWWDLTWSWLPALVPGVVMVLTPAAWRKVVPVPLFFLFYSLASLLPLSGLFEALLPVWLFLLIGASASVSWAWFYKRHEELRDAMMGAMLAYLFTTAPLVSGRLRDENWAARTLFSQGKVVFVEHARELDVWTVLGVASWILLAWFWLYSLEEVRAWGKAKVAGVFAAAAGVTVVLAMFGGVLAPPDGETHRDIVECSECNPF